MVTTSDGFIKMMKRKYPDTHFYKEYGTRMYILDKPLSEIDTLVYKAKSTAEGKFIVELPETTERSRKVGTAPTCLNSFTNWLSRAHDLVEVRSRLHCSSTTPRKMLHPDIMKHNENTPAKEWDRTGNYYMYELFAPNMPETAFEKVPYVTDKGVFTICIKTSTYKSIKARFAAREHQTMELTFRLVRALSKELVDEVEVNGILTVLQIVPEKDTIANMKLAMSEDRLLAYIEDLQNGGTEDEFSDQM